MDVGPIPEPPRGQVPPTSGICAECRGPCGVGAICLLCRSGVSGEGRPAFALTPDAIELLAQIDAGATPAIVTNNLRRIARENGVSVSDGMTPNEIIAALRAKAQAQGVPV